MEKYVAEVFKVIYGELSGLKSATKYVSPKLRVKITRRFKPAINKTDYTLTVGRPNYAEKIFIKKCQKAGEPFPVKKVQLKFYPKKKK